MTTRDQDQTSAETNAGAPWRQHLSPDDITRRVQAIHEALLTESPRLRQGNFERIANADLKALFTHYDASFFDNNLQHMLDDAGSPLSFRLSRRMTSRAGMTRCEIQRSPAAPNKPPRRYELVFAVDMLLGAFRDDDHRSITVNGIPCTDRLEALQRIFEHELLHLLELLVWQKTSCNRRRFKDLAQNLFAHTETTHQLITHAERAAVVHGVQPGARVSFELDDGERLEGTVNRVTKRATILVPDADGQRFTDGKRYAKYYVPIPLLTVLVNED